MSAEEAWEAYNAEVGHDADDNPFRYTLVHLAFMAGYRRALEDAADAFEAYGDGADAVQDDVGIAAVYAMEFNWKAAEELRARAAAV